MSNTIPYSTDYIERLKEKILECIEVIKGNGSPSERIQAEQELEMNIIYFLRIYDKNMNYLARKLDNIRESADSLKLKI